MNILVFTALVWNTATQWLYDSSRTFNDSVQNDKREPYGNSQTKSMEDNYE